MIGRHPPLIGASLLYLGFAASFFGLILIRGLEWPITAGGWQALLFIALGAGARIVERPYRSDGDQRNAGWAEATGA